MARKFFDHEQLISNFNARWGVCTTELGTSERCCRLPIESSTEMLTVGVRSGLRLHSG
jgi:hypothetical protein